jgi:hypothetical protein
MNVNDKEGSQINLEMNLWTARPVFFFAFNMRNLVA